MIDSGPDYRRPPITDWHSLTQPVFGPANRAAGATNGNLPTSEGCCSRPVKWRPSRLKPAGRHPSLVWPGHTVLRVVFDVGQGAAEDFPQVIDSHALRQGEVPVGNYAIDHRKRHGMRFSIIH